MDDGVSRSDCVVLSRRERSEEHTSELQSQSNLVCRLLLEKKKKEALPVSSHIQATDAAPRDDARVVVRPVSPAAAPRTLSTRHRELSPRPPTSVGPVAALV